MLWFVNIVTNINSGFSEIIKPPETVKLDKKLKRSIFPEGFLVFSVTSPVVNLRNMHVN